MCWDWRHLYSLSYSDSVESQRSSGEHQAVGLWHVTQPTPTPPSPPTPQQQQPRWSWRWRCWSAWSQCARVSNTWKVEQDSPQYKDHQLQVWEGPLVVRPHYSSSSHWTPHTSHLTPHTSHLYNTNVVVCKCGGLMYPDSRVWREHNNNNPAGCCLYCCGCCRLTLVLLIGQSQCGPSICEGPHHVLPCFNAPVGPLTRAWPSH